MSGAIRKEVAASGIATIGITKSDATAGGITASGTVATDAACAPTVQESVRRDGKGNWIAVSRTYTIATTDDAPFADRWLFGSFDAAKENFPALANGLAEFYDHRLLPAIRRARLVEERELGLLAEARAASLAHNERVQARIVAAEEAFGKRSAALQAAREEAEAKADEARLAAARPVGEADGLFDADAGSLGLDVPGAPSAEHVAGRDGVAHPFYDRRWAIPLWAELSVAAAIGPFVGASAFNAFGALHLARLGRDPLWLVGWAAALGVAAVFTAGRAVKGSAALAAQASVLGRKALLPTVAAAGVAAAVLAVHAVTDGVGLSRTSALRAQNGLQGALPPALVLVVASAFSFGYVAYSFVAGWRVGRAEATGPRLAYLGDEELGNRRKEWPTPERRAALGAVNECLAREAQAEAIGKRIEEAEAERARRLDALRSERLAVPEAVSDEAKDRIDRAAEDARGAQRTADELERNLARAMGEPSSDRPGQARWSLAFRRKGEAR